jgi:hypothetical protein
MRRVQPAGSDHGRARGRAAAAFLPGLVAAGCGGPSRLELTIGTSDLAGAGFYPLAGDVTMVGGAQGGFHVWLKARITGRSPGRVLIRIATLRAADGAPILDASWRQEIADAGREGTWLFDQPRAFFLCPPRPGTRVHDELVRFSVLLGDLETGETLAEAHAEATPRCPAGDPEELASCLQLCSG